MSGGDGISEKEALELLDSLEPKELASYISQLATLEPNKRADAIAHINGLSVDERTAAMWDMPEVSFDKLEELTAQMTENGMVNLPVEEAVVASNKTPCPAGQSKESGCNKSL